jgi:hypothetical protein
VLATAAPPGAMATCTELSKEYNHHERRRLHYDILEQCPPLRTKSRGLTASSKLPPPKAIIR